MFPSVFFAPPGDLTPLLPPLIDAGINGLWISNIRNTGMDYGRLRRTFGTGVALIGSIGSTALSRDESAIRRAVEEIVPPLLESGHYLPCPTTGRGAMSPLLITVITVASLRKWLKRDDSR